MEFEKVIHERRSIRKFKEDTIKEEDIEKMVEALRLAPSAKNRQPWKVMVLKGEKKDAVADIMLHALEDEDYELPGYANSSKYSALVMKQAPVVFLVLREHDDLWFYEDLISIGAAIEHLCLAATDSNLGSLWIRDTVYTQKRIMDYLGYPELDLVSAIAVGYPDEQPSPRPRKSIEEIILD